MIGLGGLVPAVFGARQLVFRYEAVFVKAEKARDGPNKSAIENTARQVIPFFVFESFQEARRDSCGGAHLLKRNATHLAFTF